jgi:hypothetical protein
LTWIFSAVAIAADASARSDAAGVDYGCRSP